jgi:hypothetical protein
MKRHVAPLLLALSPWAAADEVLLRNGGRLTGIVVEQTEARVLIETSPGRVGVPASLVSRVVRSASPLSAYLGRLRALRADDAAGWLELALWARDQGLATQARAAFTHVLALDPADSVANAALGHVRHEGRWVTPEERAQAQGLVEFEGRWITPAERAVALHERERRDRARAEREAARAREERAEARAREEQARPATDGAGLPLYGPYLPGPWPVGGYVSCCTGGSEPCCAPRPHPRATPAPAPAVVPMPPPPRRGPEGRGSSVGLAVPPGPRSRRD